jgi:type I restriction enzyme S subunit
MSQRERELTALKELHQAEIARAVTHGLNPDAPMRDSGIPWLGQIPAHWSELKLSQVATEFFRSNKDVHHQNLLSLSYGKIVRRDINATEGLLPASFDTYQIVEPGIIVLRLTDLQNDQRSLRVGLAKEEGIVTSAYLALKPRESILPEYLYLFLHTTDIHKYFYSLGSGIRQNLNFSGLRDIKVALPPIEEQQAIVDYINCKTAKIDGLIADLSAQIEKLKEYKQRLIADAVTGQIDVRK